ncbi:MAG: UDP-N-acetylmuramoyl-tripeptide--D-alanyl-D-alanine ligase [Gammaproteobacteria bacterium]|nr:UDP-N-acetylmuramoyl-tripeptide--D-alanyl-D-alanine ligase [Gammaproteobacteria bacterium]
MKLTALVVFAIGIGWFLWCRLQTYLHYFQQEQYNDRRFFNWWYHTRSFDRRVSLVLVIVSVAVMPLGEYFPRIALFAALGLIFGLFAWREIDPKKSAKKALVLTHRATRILATAWLIGLVAALWIVVSMPNSPNFFALAILMLIVLVQLIPLLLCFANIALRPIEALIQKKLRLKASAILREFNPKVIGVTGSFGKTSTKHFVAHALNSTFPTLATPGSVNTVMGITRIVREKLTAEHRYFVVEMGAYGRGSIQRLCDFTPPQIGVITAVGDAHLERFGSLDNTAIAKFEMAKATHEQNGSLIINCDGVPHEYIHQHVTDWSKTWVVGETTDQVTAPITQKFEVSHAEQSADGMQFVIEYRGTAYAIKAPLFGGHHRDNLATAFATAVIAGVPANKIMEAFESAPQTEHRLYVIKTPNGITIVDDAYNANPKGFEEGLKLLPILTGSAGRRILVTPGMLELGEHHDYEHARLGKLASKICDVVLVIQAGRIPSFIEAISKNDGRATSLMTYQNFQTAKKWTDQNLLPGDAVLFENDLPDLFESKPKL